MFNGLLLECFKTLCNPDHRPLPTHPAPPSWSVPGQWSLPLSGMAPCCCCVSVPPRSQARSTSFCSLCPRAGGAVPREHVLPATIPSQEWSVFAVSGH